MSRRPENIIHMPRTAASKDIDAARRAHAHFEEEAARHQLNRAIRQEAALEVLIGHDKATGFRALFIEMHKEATVVRERARDVWIDARDNCKELGIDV